MIKSCYLNELLELTYMCDELTLGDHRVRFVHDGYGIQYRNYNGKCGFSYIHHKYSFGREIAVTDNKGSILYLERFGGDLITRVPSVKDVYNYFVQIVNTSIEG